MFREGPGELGLSVQRQMAAHSGGTLRAVTGLPTVSCDGRVVKKVLGEN